MARVMKDSRRLPGPNVVWARPGAVLDVDLPDAEAERAVAAWRRHARAILDAAGWPQEQVAARIFPGGASLVLSAPLDGLYAATELNEWAWAAADAELDGRAPAEPLAEATARLRGRIAGERRPRLMALAAEAAQRGVTFIRDDRYVSCGMGKGSHTWPVDALPDPDAVDWERLHDVPVAVITGTNGKSTTTRLLAAICAAAGKTAGFSSTDFVKVGARTVETGDWAGPMGARLVLRRREVEVALLETARGGLLRRGLGVPRADVACVTNVAPDHLGEWGIADLDQLADVKFVVRHASARLVLNAEDEKSVERAAVCTQPITWFATREGVPVVERHLAAGGLACIADGAVLWWREGPARSAVLPLAAIPLTLGGAARFNVANAAAAVGLARALGLEFAAIRAGLRAFRSDAGENPGRLNEFDFGGVRVLVDFAHNPHGQAALYEMARALPAQRRLVTIGQAGDRSDEDIRAVALTAWRAGMDRILIKEQAKVLRGRAPKVIPGMLRETLLAEGCPPDRIGMHADELDATRAALEWSRPGDLLLILALVQREEVLAYLSSLQSAGWRPCRAVPAAAVLTPPSA
jgi:cyanophycin synthetase